MQEEAPLITEALFEERRRVALTAQKLDAAQRRFTAAVARWDALAMGYTALEIEELEMQLAEEWEDW